VSRRRGAKKQQSKRYRDGWKPGKGRDGYLKKTYGISQAEYALLAAEKCNTCWICNRPPKDGKNLNVDHDHHLEKEIGTRASIRGVLCFQCNKRLIGRRRREHASLYRQAARYLESDRAQQILGGNVGKEE
jgi:hypothetical protein